MGKLKRPDQPQAFTWLQKSAGVYMNVLKIGVLTFHRCINYGSYWQARCLAEGLQGRGHQAVLLDHYNRRVNFSEWKCAYQPVLPTPVPKADQPLYREKIERFFHAFESLPLSAPFPLHQPSAMEDYDLVVVGSDEVWNLAHPWYGGCPLFYGDRLTARHLVSYAASFGSYHASWGLEQTWAEKLRNFDAISVRDANSQALIQEALGFTPEMVLDPCLQFPVHAEARDMDFLETPYLAVYGHNFSNAFASEIRRWAAHRRLRLISIGYRNDWADAQWIAADPHDFAQFITRSEAVATNFFHGCIFALRNEKPFVCETSPYRSNKVQGLMAKVGGEKHLLTEDSAPDLFNARLGKPLDEEMLKKIDHLRHRSNLYLDGTLALKHVQFA